MEFQTNVIYYLLVIFKWTVYYLLKWIKFSVGKPKHEENTGKLGKNPEKIREFCIENSVEHLSCHMLWGIGMLNPKI